MRLLIILLSMAVPSLLTAAEPPQIESLGYRAKAYDENCRLLATGVLNLQIAPPDEDGVRRVTGDRVFTPLVENSAPFYSFAQELIGRIEGEDIHLNLNRNVFDNNTHVHGAMIDAPEPGFEGIWQVVGWGLGPQGRFVAARAPAEPTKPCEDLPEPEKPRPLPLPREP
ncbi:MAG: hypothetical protein GVY11_02285 [Gammaproteobacteria bacterium]|jgi:hypothetical protein|nr:hypothetical protein [Gammaproteobacteria bacterium]